MKITQIDIDGYGVYHDFHLKEEDLSSPIHIFLGNNEAGKSTLHSFIRSILFGLNIKGVQAYEAFSGGLLGGALTYVNLQGERIRIVRKYPPKQGKVTLYLEDGRELGEDGLREQLGFISASLYSNIFAFSLQELQKLETLQQEEISAHLYGAAMGTGAINLLEVEKKMGKVQDELFKPKATNPKLNQLLFLLEEKWDLIEELKRKLEQYTPLKKKLEWLRDEIVTLKHTREFVELERRWMERIQKAFYLKLELDKMKKLASKETRSPILLYKKEIQYLMYEKLEMIEKEKERLKLNEQLRHIEQMVATALRGLGQEWTEEGLVALNLSTSKIETLLKLVQEKNRAEEFLASKTKATLSLPLIGLSTILLPFVLFWLNQGWAGGILFIFLFWLGFKEYAKERDAVMLAKRAKGLQKDWVYELSQVGIPTNLPMNMEELSECIQRIEEINVQISQREKLLEKEASFQQSIEMWSSKVFQVAIKTGIDLNPRQPFPIFERIEMELERCIDTEEQRTNLARKILELEQELHLLKEQDSERKEEFSNMLECEEEEILLRFGKVENQYRDILAKIEEKATQVGEVKSELRGLEEEEELSVLQQEYQEMITECKELAKKWSVHAVAKSLAEEVRRTYEEKKQPKVLKEAGVFLEQMTSGRYKHIFSSMGKKGLTIVRDNGERLEVHQLSQGTKEQVYLSMRFALIREFKQETPLPILMDDIFVNFDSHRVQAALQGVIELSKTNQIFLFTCHEHIVKQVEKATPNFNLTSLSS
jgi:uncharacterized protein YhaN